MVKRRLFTLAFTLFATGFGLGAQAGETQLPCMGLQTKTYDLSWHDFQANAQTPPEKSLIAVIEALGQANGTKLKSLSAPAANDVFQTQAKAYFSQMNRKMPEASLPAKVLAYYHFGNTGIFYVDVISSLNHGVIDFSFDLKNENDPAFIIDKMSVVNGPVYHQLNDWYRAKKNITPYVCSSPQ